MADSLPYLASPGSLKTALERIQSAATPDRITADFITTKLQIKGGTGRALIPFFKKIGLVAGDGSPTDLYKKFRNPVTAPGAIASAVKMGYSALSQVNEYFYALSDKDLLGLIMQVTGAGAESSVAKQTHMTLRILRGFADFEPSADQPASAAEATSSISANRKEQPDSKGGLSKRRDFSLSYTINLNLPPTTDQAVFNAIFRSLKENLLVDDE